MKYRMTHQVTIKISTAKYWSYMTSNNMRENLEHVERDLVQEYIDWLNANNIPHTWAWGETLGVPVFQFDTAEDATLFKLFCGE